MSATLAATVVLACLIAAIALGRWLRRLLPDHHLGEETRKTIELALGLVATMAALLLGLLVSAAKDSFDMQYDQVIQMSAEVATLDRVLALYGPESAPARSALRATVDDAIARTWPAADGQASSLAINAQVGDVIYDAIQDLAPGTERQADLKDEASRLTLDLAAHRALLVAQASTTIATPLLTVVVGWLVLILLGFSLLASRNSSAGVALVAAALSVAAAIFLMLELQRPFEGMIRISNASLLLVQRGSE
jgi:Protein of unknown function (DUF4239)